MEGCDPGSCDSHVTSKGETSTVTTTSGSFDNTETSSGAFACTCKEGKNLAVRTQHGVCTRKCIVTMRSRDPVSNPSTPISMIVLTQLLC